MERKGLNLVKIGYFKYDVGIYDTVIKINNHGGIQFMKNTWTRLMCASVSLMMVFGTVGCSEKENNTNGGTTDNTTEPNTSTEEKKTVEELLKSAEEKLKEGEYGSAKKLLLEAYENKKDYEESYKIYADLYLTYALLGKKESAKSLHREVLDDLSKEDQTKYLDYMKQIKSEYNLADVSLPEIENKKEETEKETNKETNKKEETKDTKAPEFTMFSSDIYADLGEHFDYNVFFKAKDDSDFTITFDDSKINFNVAGSYPLYVTAKDVYGNTASNQANVHIIDNSFKYGAGIYKANYEMSLRAQPSTSSTCIADIPKDTKMIFEQVSKQSDGSYWGRLSTGYVCIENSQGTYLSYYSDLQIYLAQYNDLDLFATACGFEAGHFGAFGFVTQTGLNYTILCNEGNVIY